MPDRRSPWPWAIALGFVITIAVNLAFVWVATHGRDPVVPSYATGKR